MRILPHLMQCIVGTYSSRLTWVGGFWWLRTRGLFWGWSMSWIPASFSTWIYGALEWFRRKLDMKALPCLTQVIPGNYLCWLPREGGFRWLWTGGLFRERFASWAPGYFFAWINGALGKSSNVYWKWKDCHIWCNALLERTAVDWPG
jgi:hypothetical protein